MADHIRVLAVDDPTVVDLVADRLERDDDSFAVRTATEPSATLEILERERIDCVVSEYDMPGLNGLELLERVRANHPDIPFILYTGNGSEAVASDAIAAGVTDYLQKSGGAEQYDLLGNRIESAVREHRATARAEKLERVRRVLQDVNQALMRSQRRADLESAVCEILSEADPYLFAWIGEHDRGSQTVVPRASAGVDPTYLDAIDITTGDDATGRGPTGRAIETGEIAVTQSIAGDRDYQPWQAEALDRGYRSSAAIPLTFDGRLYGVLNVYSAEPEAFDAPEKALLRELGEDVAHGIHRLEQERQYRRLFENSVNGIGVHEIVTNDAGEPVDYVFLAVNPAFEELTGLEEADIRGAPATEVIPELDPSCIETFGRVALDGETARFDHHFEPLGKHFDISAFPLGDGRFVTTFSDSTDARLREYELEQIIDQMNDAVFVHRPDGEFLAINRAAIDRYGYTESELRAMSPGDIVVPETGGTADRIQQILADGRLIFETEHRTKDGQTIPVEINASRIRFYDDTAVLSIVRDVTQRKERERALTESERRYRSLFESNPAVIWEEDLSAMKAYLDSLAEEVTDIETYLDSHPEAVREMMDEVEIIDVSQQAVERYGAASKADLMAHMQDLFTEAAYEANKEIGMRLAAGETHFRVQTVAETLDGDRIDEIIDVNVPEAYTEDYSRVYLTVTDITERKEREEELRSVKNRLDLALEAGQLGVWDWDIPSGTVGRDERWAAMLGHEPGAVPDELGVWTEKVHPEDLPRAEAALDEHLAGDSAFYESEHRLLSKSGEWTWVREMGRVTEYGESGDPVRAVGVTQDIDDQKRAYQSLERQNERLDEFATMVSHDLRNPLNVATGRLELARAECRSDHLEDVEGPLRRMDEIIDEVLTLTTEREERDETETQPLSLSTVAETCWGHVETGTVALEVAVDGRIEADEGRLRHIFENLYRNAVEHGGDGVTVTVGGLEDGFFLEDDGPGIPESERERVFESGYTTNETGTGFGLAIVKKMVESHGWDIAATEGTRGGARFEITGVEWA